MINWKVSGRKRSYSIQRIRQELSSRDWKKPQYSLCPKDLRNLGVVNCRAKAQERDDWRKILEKAKPHKEF
jgi:hypothetical protein